MFSKLLVVAETVLVSLMVLLVLCWVWFQWSNRKLLRVAKNLPSLLGRSLPFLGDVHHTIHGTTKLTEMAIKSSIEAMRRGLKTACFWCGPLPLILIFGSEDVQKVLNSSHTFEKGVEMEFLKYALGEGLLTAPGHVWKVSRRHVNPLFHPRNLELMAPVFNLNCRELVQTLTLHLGRGQLDVLEPIRDITLKTICQLIFGPELEFDVQSCGFKGLRAVLKELPELSTKRVIRPWLRFDCVFNFVYKKELKEIEVMWKSFSETPLKIAKQNYTAKQLDENVTSFENTNEFGKPYSEDLLNLVDVYSVLQKKYPQFTDKELQSEMVTLYLTGENTVAFTTSTLLLALAQYPDIQERLYQEVSRTVGPDDDVTVQDLARMSYLDQVYKETLRWSTLVPVVVRKAAVDLKLSSCTIPANSSVMVCLFALHLDPNTFPDPQKFDPERFSQQNTLDEERNRFIPFSAGPRSCIGRMYAQLFVKMIVIHVVRRFQLSTTQDMLTMRRKMHIAMEGVDGYNITLENRTEIM